MSQLQGAVYPRAVVSGDTFSLALTYQDGDGNAIDLTGASATLAISWGPKPGSSVTSGSHSVAATLESGGTGQIDASIPDTVTDDLTSEHAVSYQLRLTDSAGKITTLLLGPVDITDSPVEVAE